ncbi:Ig-like domain-containing protein [Butyribacter sp.]|uniref:Ig-like domain-containing protein n=1 Tax=Butyribacter sp. TaxID=2822465 RepID=UPI002AA024CE|nr:Ig-like domain-containing protein [Butyribacter sp.]
MKIKKIISIILTVALCLTVVPIKADAKEETVKEFTEIRTIDDLYGINNNPEGNYRLMNDIDMSAETAKGGSWDTGHGWTPLKEFSGEFDGNGYRIKGMNIYGNSGRYVGLFSSITYGGKVYNLGMVDVNIGNLHGNKWYHIGTIAGAVDRGSISKCYSSGKVVCPNINEENNSLYAGGMAGYLEDNYIEISDCYSTLKIANSANADSVYKDEIYIGGIIGKSRSSRNNIEHCYNAGAVSGSAICASAWEDSEDSNYYLTGSATDGDEYAKALTPTQMSIKNMYTGFDFENTWEIDPNSSYKYPQLKGNRQQRVEGISIESLPAKLSYAQGENIDTDGGTVKITYEGGYETTVLLTKDMISDYDMTAVGEQNVKVAYGGKTAEFQIDVGRIDVTSVVVSGNSEIQKGTSSKLSASVVPQNATDNSIKWSSSDESKATVDADGNVTALATGEVMITATASNGVSAGYKINVTASCVLLILDESSITLYKGDTKEIGTKLSPIDTTDKITWNSSNSNIASVDNYGVITAVSPGETTITAKAGNAKASCQVIVKQNLSSFYIVGVEDKAYTGDSVEQNIKVTDGNNCDLKNLTISGIGVYLLSLITIML